MTNMDSESYSKKFKDYLKYCRKNCDTVLSKYKVSEADLPTLIAEKSEVLKQLCFALVKSFTPTVNSTNYASAIACLLERTGAQYKLFCGWCVPHDAKDYEKCIAKAATVKYSNHCWVEVDGVIHEYFGKSSEIEHCTRTELEV